MADGVTEIVGDPEILLERLQALAMQRRLSNSVSAPV
jgi:hypothetical protein